MSVPITVIVSQADEFSKTFSDDAFLDQIDEGEVEEEKLCSDELDYQMFLLECYDSFKDGLPEETRTSMERFANCVFWSWRDDKGEQQIDVRLDSEGLDSSFNPETSTRLLSLLGAIDWPSVESAFTPDEVFSCFSGFRLYFDRWRSILEKGSSSGRSVFVFVYP